MLDLLFKALSSLVSFAFPVFASYKALQHDDITLIKPWLIYWVIVAIQLTVESYFGFLLQVLPFFHMFRFMFMLWLVLPQTQGASLLYMSHVRPFLSHHEEEVDQFITHSHENAKNMGLEYVAQLTHYIREYVTSLVMGTEYRAYNRKAHADEDLVAEATTLEAEHGSKASSTGVASYADILFSRFRHPPSYDGSSFQSLISPITGASTALLAALQNTSATGAKSKGEITALRSKLMALVSTLDDRLKNIESTEIEIEMDEHGTTVVPKDVSTKPSVASFKSLANSDSEFDLVNSDEASDSKSAASENVDKVDEQKKGWLW